MYTNILTNKYPTTVTIGNGEYYINSDFKTMLEIDRILYKTNYEYEMKQARILQLFYPINSEKNLFFPPNTSSATTALLDFKYQKGKLSYKYKDDGKSSTLSFLLDGDAIYTDFLREYNIDLQEENIHWYKFIALISNLSSESSLNSIRNIRGKDLSQESKENQAELMKWQSIYSIDDDIEDVHEEYNKKLLQQAHKTGDYAKYRREKRG